ncbi:hypothetical protein ACMA5I_10195 [Paracoccaceae bacterium GXU_MW_L88]
MKQYRYLVRYGYDQLSKVSIEAGKDLERVIHAKMAQKPVEVGGRIFDGKHIIDIRPDYHFYTGWFPHYQPNTGDDWKQIERDCPPEMETLLSQYTDKVRQLVVSGRTAEIGKGEPLPLPLQSADTRAIEHSVSQSA